MFLKKLLKFITPSETLFQAFSKWEKYKKIVFKQKMNMIYNDQYFLNVDKLSLTYKNKSSVSKQVDKKCSNSYFGLFLENQPYAVFKFRNLLN